MRRYCLALATLVAIAGALPAKSRFVKPRDCVPCPPPETVCPPADGSRPPSDASQPGNLAQPPAPAFSAALASAGESGTQPGASFMPGFFGDLLPSTIV